MRNDLYTMFNELNNMFYDGGYKGFPIDVVEVENGYQVECEMPGIKKEDLKVTFENGELTINLWTSFNSKFSIFKCYL